MRATGAAARRPPPSPRRMPARPPTRPTSPGGARRKDPRRRCRGEAVAPTEASWRSRGAILIPRLFFPGPVEAAEIAPFAYVQATYHEATMAVPSVVPGAFSVLHGDLDNGFVHTAESLRSAGGTWLQGLPRLANLDTKDWSVAVARRPRQFR